MNTLHTVFFKISDFFTPHYIYRWFTPNSSFSPHFLLTAIPEEIPDFQEKSSTVSTFSRNLQFTSIKSFLLSSQTVNRGLVFRQFLLHFLFKLSSFSIFNYPKFVAQLRVPNSSLGSQFSSEIFNYANSSLNFRFTSTSFLLSSLSLSRESVSRSCSILAISFLPSSKS
jgi:hypothetical protein